MPFQNHQGGFQHASPLGHVPTVTHPLVREVLARYTSPTDRTADAATIKAMMIDPDGLDRSSGPVRYAIATDSSHIEPEVQEDFPSSRFLFLQMAAVIVDLQRMQTREGPFIDPVAVADAQQQAILAGALPSGNLLRRDSVDSLTGFRLEIDNLFRRSTVEGQSMLDLLLEVEGARDPAVAPPGHLVMAKCPSCGGRIDGKPIDGSPSPVLYVGAAGAPCPHVGCGRPVMAIDALRAHELFDPHGANREACGRLLSVVERFALLAVLNDVQRRKPSVLPLTSFITDGPLALFGQVAPLHGPLLVRLQQIAAAQADRGLGLPVIVGIEKTGMFVDHANAIRPVIERHLADEGRETASVLLTLDEAYVQKWITGPGSTFGKDTYYGRHFIYRSRTGSMYTITVPPLGREGAVPEDPYREEDYPTLGATCDVLDVIGTRLYPDATIPVALAHEFAAYPLHNADSVLRLHAETLMEDGAPVVA